MPATLTICANCNAETDNPVSVDGADYCYDCFRELFTKCVNCNCVISVDDAEIIDGDDYCESCRDALFVKCCTCNEFGKRQYAHIIDGEPYCEGCFEDNFCACHGCGAVVSNDDSIWEDEENWCESCHSDTFVECINCGATTYCDDATRYAGHYYCSNCAVECLCECAECGRTMYTDDTTHNDDGEWYCDNCSPQSRWAASSPRSGVRMARTKSLRRFGVELETSACPDHDELNGQTPFGCKDDGSISGMEFVSPILQGDEGLEEIARFCRLANARHFKVDSACGYHVHFDMGNNPSVAKHAALAYSLTQTLWGSFVPRSRRSNHYCGPIPWDWDNLKWHKSWSSLVRHSFNYSRYSWCNLAALGSHGTIEIRLHTSTLDPVKVNNWIVAHLRFIEWAANSSYQTIRNTFNAPNQWAAFVKIIDNAEITDYLAERARKWSHSVESSEPE